ncbi:MAG: transglycosylase SLT domain-containing protein [Sphingobacteriaceae bacterium]|nr:transglycosylase SLT domain-containing protein [Sphingobacteriaceae bacterium]
MRLLAFIFLAFAFWSGTTLLTKGKDVPVKSKDKPDSLLICNDAGLCTSVVGIVNPKTNNNEDYILDADLYKYRVDTLQQVRFWRKIMNLSADSSILCVASNRFVIEIINNKDWDKKSDEEKRIYRDNIRMNLQLDSTERILQTTGKSFFYNFDRTYQNFHKGINCFIENEVDPWYAQAILLIESPNKLQKSNAGAYGPFQLMKEVARLFGLKVNKQIDERADFKRSAFAASSLIKRVCIPHARRMLDSLGISNYQENELWFRLLVMHCYHAGSGNVDQALQTFKPNNGDMNVVYNLWHAQTRRFKSASQNYSQLILAAMLEMNDKINAVDKIAGINYPENYISSSN